MASKDNKAGGKAGGKAAPKGAGKTGAPKGGAGGKGKSNKASQPRQAMDFTKREHAGAELPVAAPRLKLHYEQSVRATLAKQFGFANPHEIPTLGKDRGQLWCRRSGQAAEVARRGGRRAGVDHRPEAGTSQGQEVDRELRVA